MVKKRCVAGATKQKPAAARIQGLATTKKASKSKETIPPGQSQEFCRPTSTSAAPKVRYVVPGDDVEDEDLEFQNVNWPLCERMRFLDPALTERTRILAAIYAARQVSSHVGMSCWALSGLFSDDPEVVLSRLPGTEKQQNRASKRILPRVTRQTIRDLADDSDISDDTFFINAQPMVHAFSVNISSHHFHSLQVHKVIRYSVTESQANADAKAGAAARKSTGERRKSRTEHARTGTFSEASDYDKVIAEHQRQQDENNAAFPWRCQVMVGTGKKKHVCGHKVKTPRGCTNHAIAIHNRMCHFLHAVTNQERKETIVEIELKCLICGGIYTISTMDSHNATQRHRDALNSDAPILRFSPSRSPLSRARSPPSVRFDTE
jgi:hypothetical protein